MADEPLVTSDVLLVGSLPFPSAREAMGAAAALLGHKLFALPDGEPPPRDMWVGYDFPFFAENPDVEMAYPGSGPPYRHMNESPAYRFRRGVRQVRWDRWPRIDDAIESYGTFCKLREEGDIPAHLRFQVGIPFPLDVGVLFRTTLERDYPVFADGYAELAGREISRLTEAIPPGDLAVQWEVCNEVLDMERVFPWTDPAGAWDRFTTATGALGSIVPEEALMGYHLCYGTFPEWPMFEPRDMGVLVRMANYAIAHSGRRVDWLHMPGPRYLRSEEDAFWRPLDALDPAAARVFLGIALPIDGPEGLKRRHAAASRHLRHLDDFGVAMYCGFGRQAGPGGIATLRDHAATVSAL